jgi:hypothetical protein
MKYRIAAIALILVGASVVAFAIFGRLQPGPVVRALAVPEGDREIAWFNTTTGGAAWERFVAGIHHAALKMPELEIDDSAAFREQTTAIPEVVVAWKSHPGKLRFRWYKQTNETSTKQWLDALAERDPPPLAIIGGGSSDRARDLAQELNACTQWKGQRPLLLITTATANEVSLEGDLVSRKLTEIYPGRSFRFCFTNEQMARAVVDFVWFTPSLRPSGGLANQKEEEARPAAFPVYWKDDPYSEDLYSKFWTAVSQISQGRCDLKPAIAIDYSVGLFDRANSSEASGAQTILEELCAVPEQRSLLILPASTAPARRFLRALAGASPLIGKNLVAVNGDAISINDVYRDGALQWNIRDVPVPLVFLAQQNPVGWDAELPGPAGTDDALLFGRMGEMLIRTVYPEDDQPAANADVLLDRIRKQKIILFDEVVYLKPEISDAGRVGEQATLEVWRRSKLKKEWRQVDPPGTLPAPLPTRTANRPTSNAP